MMERLQAATLFLFRYGGMYPFKKTNRSNHTSVSVCLVLWTVFLNLMSTLSALYFIVQLVHYISSLTTFLTHLFEITWALVPILLPMHFVCHARRITAVSTKLDEIIAICSNHNSEISKINKLKIILLIFIKIISLFYSAIIIYIKNPDNITNIQLSSIIIFEYHATFMEIISIRYLFNHIGGVFPALRCPFSRVFRWNAIFDQPNLRSDNRRTRRYIHKHWTTAHRSSYT